ncbi:hypothetical protein L3C95_18090 [Chitinophaga filiformis]|uniref:hypothetical protein n=1 Tax=Chitinophaga filiformis TaxID=104663 RepID=UPI001F2F04AC|nr:hypothetical protein [Chitinophaga filiformis]MCF6404815.1 hypothetical protein [Chitinophaga filiformis]
MHIRKISVPDGNRHYNLVEVGEYEHSDPVQKMREVYVNALIGFERDLLSLKAELLPRPDGVRNPNVIIAKVLKKRALKD